VKPENVFLTGDVSRLEHATVKVIDFGISKVASAGGEALTKTGVVMGTPDYMAPEQARGDRVDERADVYAVGAILYRALTGKKPFEGLDPMATLTAVLVSEPVRPSTLNRDVPLSLELVVQHAMAKNPKDRYPTMEALEQALAAFDPELLSRPSTAPPAASGTRHAADAKTVVSGGSRRLALRDAMEQTQQSARAARPGLLAFTGLGFAWLLASLALAVGNALRALRGDGADLSQAEAVLVFVCVGAALVTPLMLWLRHLMRDVWPSTPKSLGTMARLRRTVLYSAAAYGIVTLFLQLFFVVMDRRAINLAKPGLSLLAFLVTAVTAAATWVFTSRKR
jgi:serine/threonine-protein kinase